MKIGNFKADLSNFLKECEVKDFSCIGNKITDVIFDARISDYSFKLADTNNTTKLAYTDSKSLILKEVNDDEINELAVQPINDEQKLFMSAVLDSDIKIVLLYAHSGTGKSLTSLASAMYLIKKREKYNKILFIKRPSYKHKENLSYLKDLMVKTRRISSNAPKKEVKHHPIVDTCDYNLLNREARTLSNIIAIIDNTQAIPTNHMARILSRFDDSCKVILMGSSEQTVIDDDSFNALISIANDPLSFNKVSLWAGMLSHNVRGEIAELSKIIGRFK